MQILLINLDEAEDRLNFQKIQFEQLGLSFKRIEALKGSDIDNAFYRSVSTKGLRLMTRNEVACFLSHQKCWQYCLDINEPVVVLEDDIVLSAGFANTVHHSIDVLAHNISLVNCEMSSAAKRVHKTPLMDIDEEFHLHETQFAASAAGAYIINPETAAYYLKRAKETFNLVDLFMFSESRVKLLQIVPAPAMQIIFLSNDNHYAVTQSYINLDRQKRPSSWRSFLANPMTRVRRLKANFIALYLRHFSKNLAQAIPVVPSADIKENYRIISSKLEDKQKP